MKAVGLSERAVRDRVAAGRLTRMHRGVFAVATPTRKGRWMAAALAMGGQAVLSHCSAAALWELTDDRRTDVDVTVPGNNTRSRVDLAIHGGTALSAEDRTAQDGIPCTALPRTLLDLAAIVDRRTLQRTIDRAEALRLFDLTAIQQLLVRNRGRRGARLLRTTLATHASPTFTRSEAEGALPRSSRKPPSSTARGQRLDTTGRGLRLQPRLPLAPRTPDRRNRRPDPPRSPRRFRARPQARPPPGTRRLRDPALRRVRGLRDARSRGTRGRRLPHTRTSIIHRSATATA